MRPNSEQISGGTAGQRPPDASGRVDTAPRGSEICPFCGGASEQGRADRPDRCAHCGAYTDPLSRQASQNEMGPWFVRDVDHPFRPGCRLETIERWVRTGRVTALTVIRGPSTHQNWAPAIRVPGVAHLLGQCHACGAGVSADEVICGSCGTGLTAERDRQHLGLSPVRVLPGRGDPGEIARRLLAVDGPRAVPFGPAGDAGQSPVAGVQSARAAPGVRNGRAERRLRRANQRAAIGLVLAAVFAVLFLLSLIFSFGDGNGGDVRGGFEPGTGAGGAAESGSALPERIRPDSVDGGG